jgi:hypothetical protein
MKNERQLTSTFESFAIRGSGICFFPVRKDPNRLRIHPQESIPQ